MLIHLLFSQDLLRDSDEPERSWFASRDQDTFGLGIGMLVFPVSDDEGRRDFVRRDQDNLWLLDSHMSNRL